MRSLPPVPVHFRRRVAAVFAAAASIGALAVAAAPAADAATTNHDPLGAVTAVKAVTGGLQFTGWAVDPDAPTANATVIGVRDGWGNGGSFVTKLANAAVRSKYHTGPTPGFSVTVPIDTTKPHTVCLIARNVGAGNHRSLRCVVTPLTTKLNSSQRRAHNPKGAVTAFAVGSSTMHVTGWATDPDWFTHRLTVVLYVNGHSAATVLSHTYPGVRPTGAGRLSLFDITVPVSRGAHLGCLWVVNVGVGLGNTFLGCRSGDTRGRASTGALPAPTLNAQVATEAKKHIGQPYVWGAVGPKKFDCSGLVMYSYHKFGFTTPRISEDQFLAARLIPATRAVAGDLVFYHDTVGDVYHVGIYLGPGKTVAAIDEAEGVNYQSIWDPSSTTYGSFTHT